MRSLAGVGLVLQTVAVQHVVPGAAGITLCSLLRQRLLGGRRSNNSNDNRRLFHAVSLTNIRYCKRFRGFYLIWNGQSTGLEQGDRTEMTTPPNIEACGEGRRNHQRENLWDSHLKRTDDVCPAGSEMVTGRQEWSTRS